MTEPLSVDAAVLAKEAANFERIAEELRTVISGVQSGASGLGQHWKGGASDAGQAALVRFTEAASAQVNQLNDISNNLHTAGVHYSTTDGEQGRRLSNAMGFRDDEDKDGTEHDKVHLVDHTTRPEAPGHPLPQTPEPGGKGIELDDDAISHGSPAFPPNLKPSDPEFGSRQLSGPERVAVGTKARISGAAAAEYLRARGQGTSADLIEHYLANESGGRDPSMAKPFQLSAAQTDALASDSHSIYPEASALPTVLDNARSAALAEAARSGQAVYTEVYGGTDGASAMGRGWSLVAGSEPGNVYAMGRYSVQVVTQVDSTDVAAPVVRQRYYVYDLTDYAHPGSITGGVMDRAKLSAIDDLATLRDLGYARAFDTFGTSSIRTYP